MKKASIRDLQRRTGALVQEAADGEVIVIEKRGVPVAEYSANLVKKAVVGAGHAEKAQVQLMVGRLLSGCDSSEPDAADALAVAICHAQHAAVRRLLGTRS